jgi:hypothetical protein
MAFQKDIAPHFSSKRVAMIAMLSLLVPVATWAKSSANNAPSQTCLTGVICVFNESGTATGGESGLTMDGTNGSIASTVFQISSTLTGGTLSLTTGAVLTGTLGNSTVGNVVTFAPGLFNISTTGWQGFSGSLFSGTISGIDWIYTGHSGGFYDYTLTGFVSGTWGPNGTTVSGQTTQLFFHSKSLYKGGPISLSSGTTGLVVPEQASIGLMGTGLVAIGLLVRRKVKSQAGGRS